MKITLELFFTEIEGIILIIDGLISQTGPGEVFQRKANGSYNTLSLPSRVMIGELGGLQKQAQSSVSGVWRNKKE